MTATMSSNPYRTPPQPGRWSALILAGVMHAALLTFLWIGVRWQNENPVAVEAEVWDTQIRQAAPKPQPRPDPVIEKPIVKPIKPIPVPIPVPVPTPIVEKPVEKSPPPDIALEQEKKRKAKQEELKAIAEKIKVMQDDKAKKLKQDAEDKAQKLAEDKANKKLLADKKRLKDAAEKAEIDTLRAFNMAQITGSGGPGKAAKSSGPRGDPSYAAAIIVWVRSHIHYAGDTGVDGNPRAIFKITQLPTGEIINFKKTKSSGIPAYDDAIANAISISSPLPKKKNGTVEREIEIIFNLKE
jgi:colicin import membrane protein